MKKKYILLFVLFLCFLAESKAVSYYFYVQLKDKNNSPYSLDNPLAYLSQRALDRRAFFNVPIDATDLPVNPDYVARISNFVTVHARTKWLNGVTVQTADSNQITAVKNLAFVKFVQFTGKTNAAGLLASRQKFPEHPTAYNYGSAAAQINQLNGAVLHEKGYRGQGIHIAVIDAGFNNANNNPAFDSLRNEGRLLGTKNFVAPAIDVYTENAHGAHVLSTMAGNIKDVYVGTAPKASYLLLQSEDNSAENLCEPDFWVSAIEYADSAGVDVSTTSLGYNTFDNAEMNFTYADMNGKTARAGIAATMAADKGILVLNSAGNDGNKTWHYIGVPADAERIITVGGVTGAGAVSYFSSYGPSVDGRVKPELCAMGTSSALVSTSGAVTYGNGTSYATPILAGMAACFLQAAKEKKPTLSLSDIRDILYKSANNYATPTAQMGYGIPNFTAAYNELNSLAALKPNRDEKVTLFSDVRNGVLTVQLIEKIIYSGSARLFTSSGNCILRKTFDAEKFHINIRSLPAGVYILTLNFNEKTVTKKLIL